MDEPTDKKMLSGFVAYLSDNRLIDSQVALNAFQQSRTNHTSYIEHLVKQKLLEEMQAAQAASDYFGFPLCDLHAFNPDLVPSEFLNIHLVKRKLALPLFKKNGLVYFAITDPTVENLYELRFLTGMDVRLLIVESSKLTAAVDDMLNSIILSELNGISGEGAENITIDAYKEENADLGAYDVESAPVVNYVNRILLDAIDKNASDIHFERYEDSYRIRFRQNGVLYPVASPPIKLANYLLARIKVISNMDITEHRIPQDGRFKLFLTKKRAVDFRVSVCPTLFGEKIVLRVLDPTHINQGLAALGMEPKQHEDFVSSLNRSQGLILVTGPTGSGKTVTLYSGLNYLNSTERNISTVEDPVEIPLPGVNQVHVNLKAGLNFSEALRAFLRQDPDIIMVGEIRDVETAEIAIKASQTGHLVLSTLHTNSAPETISRLINMGIEPYNLATSLALVIAQRLVRTLCQLCKQVVESPPEMLIAEGFNPAELKSIQLFEATGCEHCTHGYSGRLGIFEVMPISRDMSYLIMRGGNALEIIEQSKKEEVENLRQSGLKKVKEGVISLSELNRVFK